MAEDDLMSTRRISALEMGEIQKALESGVVELAITVTPEVLQRIEILVPKMQDSSIQSAELRRGMALRQILMAGLYTLESEFE
ncbi:hypothetical protein FRD01_07000 [Microvenator marinus]|jgi:hypothetical protein|uniref:Uncharacterized protein n=1 Tax=Microvenator marinus TaxID=2600177 RepID=A0A5B8XMA6_9DELT|nr:hypothetical protein [Microvenator marinus]QED26992.1 hypothetical protein FRD01_07000 [Microvenator marinus]